MSHSDVTDYEAGKAAAIAVHAGQLQVSVELVRQMALASSDFARGYDDASTKLTGGHAEPILKPENVTLHRVTVEQLVDLLEELVADGLVSENMQRDAVNILPHLKLALNR